MHERETENKSEEVREMEVLWTRGREIREEGEAVKSTARDREKQECMIQEGSERTDNKCSKSIPAFSIK